MCIHMYDIQTYHYYRYSPGSLLVSDWFHFRFVTSWLGVFEPPVPREREGGGGGGRKTYLHSL